MRYDLQGRQAPAWLQSLLARRYGRTPFGEPRYRLVWAPARMERSGGVWTDWETGAVRRRVAELRWVRKYPGEQCWLVEKWLPASFYGSPAQWYSSLADGGTMVSTPHGPVPACGDFPALGDYEDIGARLHWYPTEYHLTLAVDAFERRLQHLPEDPGARARRRTHRAQEEQARRDRDFDAFCSDLFDDAAPAFSGAPMVGYGGSHRPALVEMAERAGIRQHPL